MLELCGRYFVIDHIVAEYELRSKEMTFRSYVSDILKATAESMGATVPYRYAELIEPKNNDTRTGDEVALEVIQKLGLKVKNNGNDSI